MTLPWALEIASRRCSGKKSAWNLMVEFGGHVRTVEVISFMGFITYVYVYGFSS